MPEYQSILTFKSGSRSIKTAENLANENFNQSHDRMSRQSALPTSVDWRARGYVNRIRDQGSCGACWAFSTVASLEGQYKNVTGELIEFSEQDLIDCDSSNTGCNGGYAFKAFKYLQKIGGIQGGKEFPYSARKVFFKF